MDARCYRYIHDGNRKHMEKTLLGVQHIHAQRFSRAAPAQSSHARSAILPLVIRAVWREHALIEPQRFAKNSKTEIQQRRPRGIAHMREGSRGSGRVRGVGGITPGPRELTSSSTSHERPGKTRQRGIPAACWRNKYRELCFFPCDVLHY